MISNPDLIFYACIAKRTTILTEFSSSKEAGMEAIGKQCIEKTPPHHSIFSHTIRKKTYTFLINDLFAYFVIFDENLEKSESFWFLNRVKIAFEELIAANPIKDFTYLCFQPQFYSIFREILALDVELVDSLMDVSKEMRNSRLDSTRGKRTAVKPLLSNPGKMMMKKKKKRAIGCAGGAVGDGREAHGDHHHHNFKDGGVIDAKVNHVYDNGNVVLNREFSVLVNHKNGGFYLGDNRQRAKQIWTKHVWVVLILDLVICAVLFGIWLWVCRGFKCIDG